MLPQKKKLSAISHLQPINWYTCFAFEAKSYYMTVIEEGRLIEGIEYLTKLILYKLSQTTVHWTQ